MVQREVLVSIVEFSTVTVALSRVGFRLTLAIVQCRNATSNVASSVHRQTYTNTNDINLGSNLINIFVCLFVYIAMTITASDL